MAGREKKGPRITKLSGRKKPWRVRYYDEKGRFTTKHFKEKVDADIFAENVAPALPGSAKIEPENLVPFLQLQDWIKASEIDAQTAIATALNHLKEVRNSNNSVPLQEAYDTFLLELVHERNCRPDYINNVTEILSNFIKNREDLLVKNLTPQMLEIYILNKGHSHSYRSTIKGRLSNWLNFCARKGWCRKDLCKEVTWTVKKSDSKTKAFFRPAQFEALLKALPEKYWFFTVLLFLCGIRPKGEAMRLTWDAIKEDEKIIRIEGQVSKIREIRLLYDLPDSVWEWVSWEKNRHRGNPEGKISPATYRNYRAVISKAMRKDALQGITWSNDISRHTFATFGYYRGLEWTMDQLGHVDAKMMKQAYKGAGTKQEADRFFAITPQKILGS